MIPAGYMYKNVVVAPDWLKTDRVDDIYSRFQRYHYPPQQGVKTNGHAGIQQVDY